uniref:72 kDa type IV collagenase n=1 Tax=Myxine glutinosa TaxID=7769 RepID=UPI00358EAFD6
MARALASCAASVMCLAALTIAAPTNYLEGESEPQSNDELAKAFLMKVGYYEKLNDSGGILNLYDAVRNMQNFYGLPVTGRLDSNTISEMKKPRCGVPDVAAYSHFPNKMKWSKEKLTYRILNYTPDMDQSIVDDVIAEAFKVWRDVTPLTFERINAGEADIMIKFGIKEHGDGYPFDGKDGLLAHAFPPGEGIGGDSHFDEDEDWTNGIGQVVKVRFGNSDGELCHFPFVYEGKTYNTCTKEGRTDGYTWCSTTADFDKHNKYGFCPSPELSTFGGNANEEPCKFPFTFQGKTYSACTQEGRTDGSYWCSTTSNYDDDKKYGFCPRETEGTNGGNSEGSSCTFPFIFLGETFDTCTTTGRSDGKAWCATTSNYDIDKKWGLCPGSGYSLFLVAAHEFGHALGLEHSKDKNALMFPSYSFIENFHLPKDDIDGIQDLYGVRSGVKPRVPTQSPTDGPVTNLDLCRNFKNIDAVAQIRDETYFFKDRYHWSTSDIRHKPRGPKLNQDSWPGLPAKVDALYERPDSGITIFFSGKQYWAYSRSSRQSGYPRSLTALSLPQNIERVDAAFNWKKNKKTYIFYKNKYWRYNERRQKMDPGYPKMIADNWSGVHEDLDAAFQFRGEGHSYFFKRWYYLRLEDKHVKVDKVGDIKKDWLGC